MTGGRSAPQLVLDGRPIGGYAELAALLRGGNSPNHRRSDSMSHAPAAAASILERLRSDDFARLDRAGHVYLDYTGAGLYAESQLAEHLELLRANVFGNPHSLNPTSAAMTELVEQARAAVLDFFHASPDEYVAIFTPERDRRAAAGRRGLSVPAGRPLPAHLRQPQLGQRHPRVRPRPRRRDDLRAERRARPARRRDPAAAAT